MREGVVVVVDIGGCSIVVVVPEFRQRHRRRRFQHVLLIERIASHGRRTRSVVTETRLVAGGTIVETVVAMVAMVAMVSSLGRRTRSVSSLIIGRLSFALRPDDGEGRGCRVGAGW